MLNVLFLEYAHTKQQAQLYALNIAQQSEQNQHLLTISMMRFIKTEGQLKISIPHNVN